MTNPFHAGFGVSPPLLVGRDELIEDFAEALDDGPGAAGRATLVTGARGSGKTVLLNAVEDRARQLGWLVISETATAGFAGRIAREHLPRMLGEIDPDAVRRTLTGLTAPLRLGSAQWQTTQTHVAESGLRHRLDLVTDLLAERGTGLVLTLDEVHRHQIVELRELATVVQHAFRESRQFAFVGAGLTSSVSDLVNDDVLTFLRRAERHTLAVVTRAEAERALREPIEAMGRRLDPGALELMVDGAEGYPFLLQLIGAQTWRASGDAATIDVDDARVGVERARSRLGSLVHEPALGVVSQMDLAFLRAMALDDGPSSVAGLAERLGVSVNYAGQYRLRLVAADLIHPTRRGYVDFALPYLRDYLRAHDADQVHQPTQPTEPAKRFETDRSES